MELETKNIIELHKIDKRLNQIEEKKGDLPLIIEEQEESLYDLNESIKVCDEKIIERYELRTKICSCSWGYDSRPTYV